MTIAEVLLLDYDTEVSNTRRTLERVPEGKNDWVPHEKSMKLGTLAMHCATMTLFGLYVIEALAAGVPVAQPDHSAFPEIVNSTGGGVLFPPKDSEACADAIEKLLLDPSAAHGMAQAGHRVVRERFNVEVMAREVAALCREAVASFSNS